MPRARIRLSLNQDLRPLVLFALAAALAPAPVASASTLTVIPIPTWHAGQTRNQGRAITPDGRYVVGPSYTYTAGDGDGFLYDSETETLLRPSANSTGANYYPPNILTGVGYRNDPMFGKQLVLDGMSGGYHANYCARGALWGAKVLGGTAGLLLPTANSLGATTNSHIFYTVIGNYAVDVNNQRVLYTCVGSNAWSTAIACKFTHLGFNIGDPDAGNMCGVAAITGRAVGWYRDAYLDGGLRHNYAVDFPPPPPLSYANTWDFPGLDGTVRGEAWSVSSDGTKIFGRSPIPGDPVNWHGYKAFVGTAADSWLRTDRLPDFPDTTGSTRLATPYGCAADGRYAVGMNYRGQERAVLWDTGDASPVNWTVLDLTERAASEGILGSFTRLYRAFSVGTNSGGNPVVTGVGAYQGGNDRAFIMVVTAPVPRITSFTGVGSGTITVNYTNTVPGKIYMVQYNTNLNATAWYAAGIKTATGTTDFQTVSSVTSARCYYRLYTP